MQAERKIKYFAPEVRLHAGPGSLIALAGEMDRLGLKRAVVICGRTIGGDPVLAQRLEQATGGRLAGIWSGVVPHSSTESVRQAAGYLKEVQADCVIGIGGGSAIVTARAASIYLAESGDGRDFKELSTSRDERGALRSPRLSAPKLPQFVVPTTPTTAYPKVGGAVQDEVNGERLAMFDPKIRARAIFLEPDLLAAAPQSIVASSALNTLAMAVEGLLTGLGNPASDAMLIHALQSTSRVLSAPDRMNGVDERLALTWAAGLCGLGTDSAGGGVSLALGHAAGMIAHTQNGHVNAICLGAVLEWYGPEITDRLTPVCEALDLGRAQPDPVAAINARISEIRSGLNIPGRLGEIGIDATHLQRIATESMKDWVMTQAARKAASAEDLLPILQELH